MPPRRDLLFVAAQALLLAALALDPELGWRPLRGLPWIGWTLCGLSVAFGTLAVLQLGTSLTPWPTPRAGSALVTEGTYRVARHPIYASLIAFAVGLALATGSPWRLLVAAALYVLFCRKARYEEALLRERYAGYEAYAREVGRFGW